jgi:hypothetical protein
MFWTNTVSVTTTTTTNHHHPTQSTNHNVNGEEGRSYPGSTHHLRDSGLLLHSESVLHGGGLELFLHGLERLYLLHGLKGKRLLVGTSFTPRARTSATAPNTA